MAFLFIVTCIYIATMIKRYQQVLKQLVFQLNCSLLSSQLSMKVLLKNSLSSKAVTISSIIKKSSTKMLLCILGYFSFAGATQSVPVKSTSGLPQYVVDLLTQFGVESESEQLVVSSKSRTPEKQAEVMIDYYIECSKGLRPLRKLPCGVDEAVAVYGRECQPPIRLYSKQRSRRENIKTMGAAIADRLKLIGNNRHCMTHVSVEGVNLDRVTVDVKPSSVANRVKFYDAVVRKIKAGEVLRFYYPTVKGRPPSRSFDSAFHLEFKKKISDKP